MKKFFLFLISSLLISVSAIAWSIHTQYTKSDSEFGNVLSAETSISSSSSTISNISTPDSTPTPTLSPTTKTTPIPTSALLAVPYTLQSPFNIWDSLHEDACEETSLIMVKHFLDGTSISSKEQANKEITDLVNWETTKGYEKSITLDQLNQIAKDYYGLKNGQIIVITSIDQVKQEIADGHPVISGMAGKLLPNPYFKNGGPNYHMLVAKGYDESNIITNEPGTRLGDGYKYDNTSFDAAIHDWNAIDILNGQKAYLVFK